MDAKAFDLALRSFANRRPFKPFVVEFSSGTRLEVEHPEALVTRHGVAIHFATDGNPTLFDQDSVSQVTGIKKKTAATS
ncbi:MAG: hypothetical protein EXS16_00475 [Gemmataceae bacterium]|nr:hypothetical protein [Gemmataceae bacterium]